MKKNKIQNDADLANQIQMLTEKFKQAPPEGRRKSLTILSEFIEKEKNPNNKAFFIELKNKLESFGLEVTGEN